ncbi:MAG TPA: hypothetical protein PKE06_06930 [Flavilitoribacter sp.]|nr:hypothetical protein [Flavilitoribacter sp.]HMQ86248.1 hypothetical protein [Flavilitoribacter sp.]
MPLIDLTGPNIQKDGNKLHQEDKADYDGPDVIFYEADMLIASGGQIKDLVPINIVVKSSKYNSLDPLRIKVLAKRNLSSPLGFENLAVGPWPPYYHQTSPVPPGTVLPDDEL